jgi:hypothetical protein
MSRKKAIERGLPSQDLATHSNFGPLFLPVYAKAFRMHDDDRLRLLRIYRGGAKRRPRQRARHDSRTG